MLIPLSWLKKYVPVSLPPSELARRLTMAGTEVEAVHEIGGGWEPDKVLVGRVVKVDPHPNADRLTLPTVDLGNGETATVVCGAPNVVAGQKIAFAREGARLVSPRTGKIETLKKSKIRGVVSAGMVCSDLELGLGDDHEGIRVLDEDAPVGTPLIDYLGDTVFNIDVTPNRPDCLSVLGVAHEVAALTGEEVAEPDLSYTEDGAQIEDQVTVEIADPDLCYRYTASLITGITVGPSPRWLTEPLEKAGQRPINNIVDVTNYVMLEYNQPLHAFDFDTVKDRTITVREARPGETLVTLDGENRRLGPPMLMVADSTDAVGLAGVMGGASTEIGQSTTSVLLESANFNPVNTRRTAATLGLSTEASYRFERGIRADLAPLALRRATQLILQVAGGKASKGIIDAYPGRQEPPAVKIGRARIEQVLGVDVPMAKVEEILTSLGFSRAAAHEEGDTGAAESDAGDSLRMKAPYWRSDIAIEDDLVEEVARVLGYDGLPTSMMSTAIPHQVPQPFTVLKDRVKDLLAASGMREVVSYPLTDLESLGKANSPVSGTEPLKIANPMTDQLAYLRTTLRSSILQVLARNWRNAGEEGVRLFEMGRAYLAKDGGGVVDLPIEREMLIGVLSGQRMPVSWLADRERMDFFDSKGVIEVLLGELGVQAAYEPAEDPIMHPGKTADIVCDNERLGVVGEVHPRVLSGFDIAEGPVAMFEIDLQALFRAAQRFHGSYSSASRFPDSERDLALVVADDVPADRIRAIIDHNKLVVRSVPFDLYEGREVPAGKKSIAYRIVFQSPTGTLTSEQVSRAQEHILRQLQQELGAELRV